MNARSRSGYQVLVVGTLILFLPVRVYRWGLQRRVDHSGILKLLGVDLMDCLSGRNLPQAKTLVGSWLPDALRGAEPARGFDPDRSHLPRRQQADQTARAASKNWMGILMLFLLWGQAGCRENR